ncbi:MAG: hypothetical protein WBQ65_08760 [Bryobacteraceae bacterium]
MGRIVLSVVLGLLSPFVFIMGAEPFEVSGKNSIQEVLAGCIAVALYLAVCQFLVARNSGNRFRADWPILAAMMAPVLAMFFFIAAVEKGDVMLEQGVPMLLAGCIGCLAGSVAGHRGTSPARARSSPDGRAAWRVILRAGAGLFLVVAATLVVVVIPAVARDTSPHATPGPAAKAFIVSVVLHGFLAALILWRSRGDNLPVMPGVFGLLLGLLLLAPAAGFAHHGPAMHPAVIALWASTGIDFVVGACSLVAAAMVRKPGLPEGELRFP